jgi:hypothetical protein
MMTKHAKLSASGAHRWLECLGSVEAEKSLPNTTSFAADEGTAAHELAEIVLESGGNCQELIGNFLIEMNEFVVTQEMADYVQQYVDYVTAQGGTQFYEERVDFSEWVPEGFGTSDVIIIKDDTIHVIDLKYGKGLRVDAENNPQAMLYALGAYSDYGYMSDFKTVKISIVQPRLDHIDEWEISVTDLLKWGAWAAEQAETIAKGDAKRTPGEKACQWCKAKATCPALKSYTEKVILSQFDELELTNADTLNNSQIRQALEAKKLIVSWLDSVENLVKSKLEAGESFPGFKLVAGRSLRKWSDEQDAEKALLQLLDQEAYEKKLLTPAKAEKALGKTKAKAIQGLIVKPEGAPTLAPESDKRKSISISVDDFDIV